MVPNKQSILEKDWLKYTSNMRCEKFLAIVYLLFKVKWGCEKCTKKQVSSEAS